MKVKFSPHRRANVSPTYDELYPVMPEDELIEAQEAYAQARMITVKNLGRPLTAQEFRERARLYAIHQALTRRYDPLHQAKVSARGKLYRQRLSETAPEAITADQAVQEP